MINEIRLKIVELLFNSPEGTLRAKFRDYLVTKIEKYERKYDNKSQEHKPIKKGEKEKLYIRDETNEILKEINGYRGTMDKNGDLHIFIRRDAW